MTSADAKHSAVNMEAASDQAKSGSQIGATLQQPYSTQAKITSQLQSKQYVGLAAVEHLLNQPQLLKNQPSIWGQAAAQNQKVLSCFPGRSSSTMACRRPKRHALTHRVHDHYDHHHDLAPSLPAP